MGNSSWDLNPRLLKLFAWSKDFNPNVQHQKMLRHRLGFMVFLKSTGDLKYSSLLLVVSKPPYILILQQISLDLIESLVILTCSGGY